METLTKLKDLKALYDSGELGKDDTVWIDNDCTGIWSDKVKFHGDGPEQLLEEALTLLGIPNSPV